MKNISLNVKNSHKYTFLGLPWWLNGKESTCQDRRRGFYPWVGKISWRRKWHPTPVLVPEKSCGQRSLVGYSLWGSQKNQLQLSEQTTYFSLASLASPMISSILREKKQQGTGAKTNYQFLKILI